MGREIYFDNNATTSCLPEVRQAMVDVLGAEFGNPSSVHAAGERGRLHFLSTRIPLAEAFGRITLCTQQRPLQMTSFDFFNRGHLTNRSPDVRR